MLEIPNDQFQLEPIYKPIPVGIWVNWLESLLEHVAINFKKSEKNIKKKIKILIGAKTSCGIYLLEVKFTLTVGMYNHFSIC